jgi:hypothetical protein
VGKGNSVLHFVEQVAYQNDLFEDGTIPKSITLKGGKGCEESEERRRERM